MGDGPLCRRISTSFVLPSGRRTLSCTTVWKSRWSQTPLLRLQFKFEVGVFRTTKSEGNRPENRLPRIVFLTVVRRSPRLLLGPWPESGPNKADVGIPSTEVKVYSEHQFGKSKSRGKVLSISLWSIVTEHRISTRQKW